MSTTSDLRTDEATPTRPRVHTDLRAGGLLLAVVIGGHLLWQASDAGLVTAIAGR